MKSNRARRRKFPKRIFFLITLLLLGGVVIVFVYKNYLRGSADVVRPIPLNLSFNLPVKEDEKIGQVRSYLKKEKIESKEIKLEPDLGIIIKLDGNGEIYLSEENYPAELASLQVILKRLTMEGKSFKRLDLRYEHPIIVL